MYQVHPKAITPYSVLLELPVCRYKDVLATNSVYLANYFNVAHHSIIEFIESFEDKKTDDSDEIFFFGDIRLDNDYLEKVGYITQLGLKYLYVGTDNLYAVLDDKHKPKLDDLLEKISDVKNHDIIKTQPLSSQDAKNLLIDAAVAEFEKLLGKIVDEKTIKQCLDSDYYKAYPCNELLQKLSIKILDGSFLIGKNCPIADYQTLSQYPNAIIGFVHQFSHFSDIQETLMIRVYESLIDRQTPPYDDDPF